MSKKSFARLVRIVTGTFGTVRDEAFSFETSLSRFEKFVGDAKAGTRDENFNPRPSPALAGISAAVLSPDRDEAFLRTVSPVTVNAPGTVTVNVWRSAGGKSVDVHLLNYDVAAQKNEAHPVSGLQVTVELPKGFTFDKAILTRPGVRRIYLSHERVGDSVRVSLPTLDDYAIISFTTEQALDDANRAIRERIKLDRDVVKKQAAEGKLY